MSRKTISDDDEALIAVGLGSAERQLYEALLAKPGATLSSLVASVGWSAHRTRRVLAMLELKGLTTRSPERNAQYLPTPPDIAIEALIAERHRDVERARAYAARLQEKSMSAKEQRDKEHIVELVTGRDAQARVFDRIQRGAQNEVLSIERMPYVVGVDVRNEAQEKAMARGVRYRNIVDVDALKVPGNLEKTRTMMAAGEQTRVFSGLPLKMVIVDHRVAITPLRIESANDSALLLRPSSLLDALCALFEMFWQRATPINFDASLVTTVAETSTREVEDLDRLITLLAAGLNDKATAHELGISARTLDRRLVDLADSLDARTRFQTGWIAALRASGKLRE